MLVIGLTGSIGSGKSTVANLFKEHGVPVIDADVVSREVTQAGSPALQEIKEHFGQAVISDDGSLDRGSLREIIFSNPEERRWLESLLHPAILDRMRTEIKQLNAPYCLAVIPLLLETDAADFVQRILVVDLPEETQLNRASLRDNKSTEHIKRIISAQAPRNERLAKADDIINNAGDQNELAKQVDKLHQMYLKLVRK